MNILVNYAQRFKMGLEINSYHFSESKCQMLWSWPETWSNKNDLYTGNNLWYPRCINTVLVKLFLSPARDPYKSIMRISIEWTRQILSSRNSPLQIQRWQSSAKGLTLQAVSIKFMRGLISELTATEKEKLTLTRTKGWEHTRSK